MDTRSRSTRIPPAAARQPQRKAAPARPRPRAAVIAAIVIALIAIIWFVWPSPYSKVKNLSSSGWAIVAFGDSLTAGYGAQPGEDYPSRLATIIGGVVVNAGVSGDTTEAALARIDTDVLARNPRIVIVGLGGNDFLRGVPISVTEANLRTIVAGVQHAGAMVVILEFRFPSLNARYDQMYERVAKESGCLLISGVLRGILTDPSLKSDEIHPNARGYQLMAERVAGPLRKLIKRADAAR